MSFFDTFGSAAVGATFGAIAGATMDAISPNSSNVFDFCSDSSSMLNGAINGALIGGTLGAAMDNFNIPKNAISYLSSSTLSKIPNTGVLRG